MHRVIAVAGPGHCSRREYDLACDVGRLLAGRGFVVATGGLFGVMEAACMGAKEAGGTTLGVLPSYARTDANRYVDLAIPTGLRHARNVVVAVSGEAMIAVGGGLGTLSEIAIALRHGIPVVGLGTWRLDPDRLFERRVPAVKTPQEAVDAAIRFADDRARDAAAPFPVEEEDETAEPQPDEPLL